MYVRTCGGIISDSSSEFPSPRPVSGRVMSCGDILASAWVVYLSLSPLPFSLILILILILLRTTYMTRVGKNMGS